MREHGQRRKAVQMQRLKEFLTYRGKKNKKNMRKHQQVGLRKSL